MSGAALARVAIAVAASLPSGLAAHEGIEERLDSVNAQLADDPRNPKLIYERAELRRSHYEWEPAIDDYRMALRLDPALDGALLGLGHALVGAGRGEEAQETATRLVERLPSAGPAWMVRARALRLLGRDKEAAESFAKGIAFLDSPRPEDYLELVETLTAPPSHDEESGPPAASVDAALAVLDRGLERCSNAVTLQLRAIELERRRSNPKGGLARIDTLLSQGGPSPHWLSLRGDLAAEAGDDAAALGSYREALNLIEQLPERRQRVPAFEKLAAELREKAASLTAAAANAD